MNERNLTIIGAAGRMGTALISCAGKMPGINIIGRIARNTSEIDRCIYIERSDVVRSWNLYTKKFRLKSIA